ncbi:MAG TPA: hypothetical protein VF868_11585 [Bacteroidia bacterium]|jgi:hypothetical protein
MYKAKRILYQTFIITLFLLAAAAIHFILFPYESRCMLIDLSGLKKEGRLYFSEGTPQSTKDSLRSLIEKASIRVSNFWGEKRADPKFIYCDNEEDFKIYGSKEVLPAVTMSKLGHYIVISREGLDLDIISHELSHTELYERVGFSNKTFNLPLWFDEGLAMQNDFRDYYSEDTLKALSANFTKLPGIRELETPDDFYAGTPKKIMLNYMTARHEVLNWYTKPKLDKFIELINSGEDFEAAYLQKEEPASEDN